MYHRRERPQDKGLSNISRVQEKDDPKGKSVPEPTPGKRTQPHNTLTTTIVIILPLVSTPAPKARASANIWKTTSVILPIISLHLHHKPNPPSPIIQNLPSAITTNNIPHGKYIEASVKI
jgi:hypothetical protein